MPTNRKRIARGRVSTGGITEIDYEYYTFGPFFEAEDYENGKTKEELKAFWQAHRKAIMDRYMEENRLKGLKAVRPSFFWDDITAPQRKTPPGEFEATKVWDHQRKVYDWVENDFDLLKRLNLLEDWELKI